MVAYAARGLEVSGQLRTARHATQVELEQLKLERKAVLEREKECKELANYLVSLRRMEDEQSGLVALAS